jgi:uncharacterized protein
MRLPKGESNALKSPMSIFRTRNCRILCSGEAGFIRDCLLKCGLMLSLNGTRILVSGSSGLVGSALVPSLKSAGARVERLVRAGSLPGSTDEERIQWDPSQPISPDVVSGFDAVIHLAGESVLGRWTEKKKARIRNSRIPATSNLARALAQAKAKPHAFLSASAIGYYGNRGDEILREESPFGTGFAADLARDWEDATKPAVSAGIRTAQMRIGVILAKAGGALTQMLPPFKLGLGGRVGSGKQWMSWIDLQDIVGAIQHIVGTDSVSGPVNLVAPKPVQNFEFSETLASTLHRPALFPAPAFAMRLAFGDMADELLLASQRVEPKRLLSSGYQFRFSEVRASVQHILQKSA